MTAADDLSTVTAVVTQMQSDMSELKASIKSIAEALTKLAVLDDRQLTLFKSLEKQLIRMENLESRLHRFEVDMSAVQIAVRDLLEIRSSVHVIQAEMTASKVRRETISNGAKALWAVIGSIVTGAVMFALFGVVAV